MNVTQWHGCYNGSWNGILVPDAFAHPAKFAPMLIYRILRHMLERGYIQPGDSLLDPFGGIGSGGYYAMLLGLHWTGVELEPRFVELGQRNIDKWRRDLAMLNGTLGTARLLQGDSRRLLEVVGGGMAAAVSSPPYEGGTVHGDGNDKARHTAKGGAVGRWGSHATGEMAQGDYGSTPGQLGSMPSGSYAAAVGSPPYSGADGEGRTTERDNRRLIEMGREDLVKRLATEYRGGKQYGAATPGQLGTMPNGSFDSAVSSPPYADAVNGTGEGPGARHDPIHHNGDNSFKASSDSGYGSTPGNVGNMRDGGFEGVVSSPPFESSITTKDVVFWENHNDATKNWNGATRQTTDGYGSDPANIGNDTGDTFWTAARAIVEQTYAALRPGGYAAWVCKDFVRKGQRVPFSDQWEQLCAACGFEPVERIAALLYENHGTQLGMFGENKELKKERMSFFRRLAHKNGSPYIGHEDVIIMRKPNA